MIEDIVLTAKTEVYSFAIALISILSIILHPIITSISYKPSKNYWEVWGTFSIILLFIMAILLLAPDWILKILNSIQSLGG